VRSRAENPENVHPGAPDHPVWRGQHGTGFLHQGQICPPGSRVGGPPLPSPPLPSLAASGPLYQAVQVIVVPHEGVECPQLGPAHTQLLRGVAQEATDVRPNQGHPQQVKLQDFWEDRGRWASGYQSRASSGQVSRTDKPSQDRSVDPC
jgi:hypothetical protein